MYLYVLYMKPLCTLSNYRITGIRGYHLRGATSFSVVRANILRVLRDHGLVGHDVKNDFKVKHLRRLVRDTAFYMPLRKFLAYHNVLRKTVRYWKTLFYHMVDIAVVNSFILYNYTAKLSSYTGLSVDERQAVSLKNLEKFVLKQDIQVRAHSASEDAAATMPLYKTVEIEWEREVEEGTNVFSYACTKAAGAGELVIF